MSLSTKILSPFWEAVAHVVPSNVAPNVLTLAGLLCTIQAFYLCYSYMAARPQLVTVAAAALVFAYQTLDALDGIQARRTSNASPVGALWDHACDNVAIVFVSLVGCYVIGLTEPITMWYVVQFFSIGLMLVHLDALPKGQLRFGLLTGPGEAIFVFLAVLLSYAFFGAPHLQALWAGYNAVPLVKVLITPSNLYYAVVTLVLVKAMLLPAEHTDTRRGVLFCMLFRIAPAVLYYLGWVRSESLLNVVCDGLIVSVITTDLAVARMARRPLHPWVWLFAMASVISYMAIVGAVLAYYLILFFELTSYMKLPMFTMLVNVYVDGVYDCKKSLFQFSFFLLTRSSSVSRGPPQHFHGGAAARQPSLCGRVVRRGGGGVQAEAGHDNGRAGAGGRHVQGRLQGDSRRAVPRHSRGVSAQAQHPHCLPVDRVRQDRRHLLCRAAQAGHHPRPAPHRGHLHL